VLTDQNMPRMDGLQLIKLLRELPSYAKTPILMLTTESSDEMKAKGRRRRQWLAGQAFRSTAADRGSEGHRLIRGQ
jgi:CheY-like chemotaxis protein